MNIHAQEDVRLRLTLQAILDKKGEEVVVIDLEEKASFCSYFVIVSGTSSVHLDTIADAIDEQLSREQYKINHVEGIAESGWIVLDIGDIIVHIFHPEKRRFYNLERLWADARLLDVGQIVKT